MRKQRTRYQLDKPLPGESLDEYLRRHRAHPDDKNPRHMSEEEMAEFDRTDEYLGQGFILTKK